MYVHTHIARGLVVFFLFSFFVFGFLYSVMDLFGVDV